MAAEARERLLDRVLAYAAQEGITGRSLRDIARGAGTSHRMLLYHFGSREGLLAAVVAAVEARQRVLMTAAARGGGTPAEVMNDLWARVSEPALRPAVALFFEVFGLVAQGAAGTEELRAGLTRPWLDDAAAAAEALGVPPDPAGALLGVAVTRGLLMELLAGADRAEVDAAYQRFVEVMTAPH
ncbi:MAG: TetR/AcrR family transcriptional regulator [Pseudonocardia sp.]